ncbi:hypothetical protein [Streptomyces mirabilis]|uniref:hypothetical protein n=1 Tax=Streptomyces mirabilis TaxID=68239 RepID=UPI003318EE6E
MTNSTANQGGAIFVNQGSTLDVHDSVLRDIAAQQGGAIYNGPRSTTLLENSGAAQQCAQRRGYLASAVPQRPEPRQQPDRRQHPQQLPAYRLGPRLYVLTAERGTSTVRPSVIGDPGERMEEAE